MNLEDVLAEGIPTAEAADFFIRVRGKDKLASLTPAEFEAGLAELPAEERAALLKGAAAHLNAMPGAVKRANMQAGESAPPTLPATAMGKNMTAPPAAQLPATAMGQNAVKTAGLSEKHEDEVGRARGRAATSAHFEREKHRGKEKNRELAGRLAGGAAGGAAAHFGGKKRPLSTLVGVALGSHLGGKAGKRSGQVADQKAWEKKHASAFKEALDASGLMPAQPGAVQEPQGLEPTLDPETEQYLASEQAAEQEAEMQHASFLRQKLQEAQAQLQEAQQLASTSQEQQAAHDGQLQMMQQQVADATLKATQAEDRVLQHQQAAAAMRMAFQQLRGQVLQLAANDPPTLSPDAQALIAAGQSPQGAGGMPGAQPPTAGAPAPQQGPAGDAASPGAAPNAAPAAGEEAVNQNADSKKEEPTGEAKPSGEKSDKENKSESDSDKGDDRKVSVKVGGVYARAFREVATRLPFSEAGKTAAPKGALKALGAMALGGGALGAITGGALGGVMTDELRSDARRHPDSSIRQFGAKHPVAYGALTGGVTGALGGALAVPGLPTAAFQEGKALAAPLLQRGKVIAGDLLQRAKEPIVGALKKNEIDAATQQALGIINKTASLKDMLAGHASKALAVLPHAAVGGAVGAGLGAGEAFTSNEPLRQKVQGLEAKEDRGFRDTADLAQAKARLTMGEFAEKHPAAAMGAGALAGALTGATQGPAFVGSVQRSAGHLGNIGKHMKSLITKGAA